jgi:hypothetical protein
LWGILLKRNIFFKFTSSHLFPYIWIIIICYLFDSLGPPLKIFDSHCLLVFIWPQNFCPTLKNRWHVFDSLNIAFIQRTAFACEEFLLLFYLKKQLCIERVQWVKVFVLCDQNPLTIREVLLLFLQAVIHITLYFYINVCLDNV